MPKTHSAKWQRLDLNPGLLAPTLASAPDHCHLTWQGWGMALAILQEGILFTTPFWWPHSRGAQTRSVGPFGWKAVGGLRDVCRRGDKIQPVQEAPLLGWKSAGTQPGESLASQNLLLSLLPGALASPGGPNPERGSDQVSRSLESVAPSPGGVGQTPQSALCWRAGRCLSGKRGQGPGGSGRGRRVGPPAPGAAVGGWGTE